MLPIWLNHASHNGEAKTGNEAMKITNDTTTYQVAELMGTEADELDGRIMLGLLSRECVVDTDDLTEDEWLALVGGR